MRWVLLALLTGCSAAPSGDPCRQIGDPRLDLAPADGQYGAPVESLFFGIPPQGGAPYTPLKARVDGLALHGEYVNFQMTAVDPLDGTDLGGVDYDLRPICANVGDSAGLWVMGELHHRYFDWSVDELAGHTAQITVVATDIDGVQIESTITGTLSSEPPEASGG